MLFHFGFISSFPRYSYWYRVALGGKGRKKMVDLIYFLLIPYISCFFTLKFSVLLQPSQIVLEDNTLVSRYISNPLLIDGECA